MVKQINLKLMQLTYNKILYKNQINSYFCKKLKLKMIDNYKKKIIYNNISH